MSELALRLIKENKKTKAKSLDLGNCGLTEVPEEVGELVWLEELILSSEWAEYDVERGRWDSGQSQNKNEVNKFHVLPLTNLRALKKLVFGDSEVTDLAPLANLSNLEQLYFRATDVSDLSPIAKLSNLKVVHCSGSSQIKDISPLKNLSNLEIFSCSSTKISNLSPLANLSKLHQLNCSHTQVSNLAPLLPFIQKGKEITFNGYIYRDEFDFNDCPLTNPPVRNRQTRQRGHPQLL